MILDGLAIAVLVVFFLAVLGAVFSDGGVLAVAFVFGVTALLVAAAMRLDGVW